MTDKQNQPPTETLTCPDCGAVGRIQSLAPIMERLKGSSAYALYAREWLLGARLNCVECGMTFHSFDSITTAAQESINSPRVLNHLAPCKVCRWPAEQGDLATQIHHRHLRHLGILENRVASAEMDRLARTIGMVAKSVTTPPPETNSPTNSPTTQPRACVKCGAMFTPSRKVVHFGREQGRDLAVWPEVCGLCVVHAIMARDGDPDIAAGGMAVGGSDVCITCAAHCAETERLLGEVVELQASADLRWKADMRAIKRWQEATGRDDVWPDHADLCVFLMDELTLAKGEVQTLLDELKSITSTAMCVKQKNTTRFIEHLAERIKSAEAVWDARQSEKAS